MTMKTTQDISPLAVVCLSLGLLIGTVLMPEYRETEDNSYKPPESVPGIEVTFVDVKKGRLLERSPTALAIDPGQTWQAHSPDTNYEAKEISEHAELAALSVQHPHNLSLDLDVVILVLLGVFVTFGIAVMHVDIREMSEEAKDVSYPSLAALTPSAGICPGSELNDEEGSHSSWQLFFNEWQLFVRSSVRVSVNAAVLTAASLVAMTLYKSCSELSDFSKDDHSNELRDLGSIASRTLNICPALVPDNLLMLALGAVVALGAAVMRTDQQEMVAELQTASKHDAAVRSQSAVMPLTENESVRAGPSLHHFSLRVVSAAAFAAIASISLMVLYGSCTELSDSSESLHSQELRDLALLTSGSLTFPSICVPDGLLILGLGAFVALGAGVMRVDQQEIAAELRTASKPDVTRPSPSGVMPLIETECAHAGQAWQRLSLRVVATATSAAIASISLMTLYKSCTGLSDPSEPPQSQELRDLALLTSGPMTFSSVCVPDGLLMLGLGAFVAFGAAVMRVDQQEIAAELQTASKPDVTRPSPSGVMPLTETECAHAGHSWQRLSLRVFATATFAGIASISLMALYKSCTGLSGSSEPLQSQELRDLALLTSGSLSFSSVCVPDGLLILGLGAFVALGAAVMRADQQEIAAELQTASEPDVASPSQFGVMPLIETECAHAGSSWPRFSLGVVATAASAAIASISLMALYKSCTGLSDSSEPLQSQELRDLALLTSGSLTFSSVCVPDGLLMLGIGAFVALGAAVMRADVHEMSEEFENSPELELIMSTPTVVSAPGVAKVTDDCASQQRFSQYFAMASLLVVTTAVAALAWSVADTELLMIAEGVGVTELRGLVHSSSSSWGVRAALIPNSLLVLAFGVFAMLGAVIMQVDIVEMSEGIQHASKSDAVKVD